MPVCILLFAYSNDNSFVNYETVLPSRKAKNSADIQKMKNRKGYSMPKSTTSQCILFSKIKFSIKLFTIETFATVMMILSGLN